MLNPLDNNIKFLKGVGQKRAELFSKLGIFTVRQLLFTFPRDYEDRKIIKKISEANMDELCTIAGVIITPITQQRARSIFLYKFSVSDGLNTIKITLFNQKYLAQSLNEGKSYLFYGKVGGSPFLKEMTSPVIEEIEDINTATGKIVPIYPLTASLTNRLFSLAVENALLLIKDNIEEPLSKELREKWHLSHIRFALEYIHKPSDFYKLDVARRRFVFEELLILQLGLLELKKRNRGTIGFTLDKNINMKAFFNALPFELTNAQKHSIKECLLDMQKNVPMNRLLQGDVGSGKTVVATALSYYAIQNDTQVCLMAPTEILASQHYNSISEMMATFHIRCALLTGGTPQKEKLRIIDEIKSGEIQFVIGTHSLIEERVEFLNLSLVITDEQHRFGVKQRALLSKKGDNPHTLVMSATPIPRTLALIVYGDLDISVINELPPGRKKISTYLADDSLRERIYSFVAKEIKEGRQAYIVCPLIEENDRLALKAVAEFSKELSTKYLSEAKVAFLHGKMKGNEKNKIMEEFYGNKINVLVSTTVIEVGVNVPNATIMIVENAERFGLSQLHQLRGRVGRGTHKSYCILMSNAKSSETKKRLTVLTETNDGFKISEKDLELRGAGDFFGNRQHGLPPLKIANLIQDIEVLKEALAAAREIIKEDETLSTPQNEPLKNEVKKLFSEYGLVIFN